MNPEEIKGYSRFFLKVAKLLSSINIYIGKEKAL